MTAASAYWFSPLPSELSASRVSLDFGLRAADLFFRELVVPGLGRLWFVRQLSWPLAALALHEELQRRGGSPPKPTAICHGVEALACRLEYEANSSREARSRRILGSRAFDREDGEQPWTFRRLRQASNYVRNTHRQAAARAIRAEGGLGFALGSRFDLLELEPIGHDLARAFLDQSVGQGGTKLRQWLIGWLRGEKEIPASHESFRRALSPEHATAEECSCVSSRLLRTADPASTKRQRLAAALGRAAAMPDIENTVVVRLEKSGHGGQAAEILAARSFGAVLDRVRDLVANATHVVEPARVGVKIVAMATDRRIGSSLKSLRSAVDGYAKRASAAGVNEPTSLAFVKEVLGADDVDLIKLAAARAGGMLGLADGCVVRGPLFGKIGGSEDDSGLEDSAASIEPDRTGRTFRMANLHALLRDVQQGGAR